MARYQITISGKGLRKETIEKLVNNLKDHYGEKASIGVRDATPPESRADRFAEAIGQIGDAKSEIESLKDELDEWYNNLPQGFQDGDKGQQLQDAVSQLEECIGNLESAEVDVEFPGMY